MGNDWSWGGALSGGASGAQYGPIGAIAGFGIGGITGAASETAARKVANAQNDINVQNQQNFERVIDWETYMSNTAHQREVADLKAAGLNPILSATHGGAVTPSSGLPVQTNPKVDMVTNRAAIMNANANSAKMISEAGVNKAQAALMKVQAKNAASGSFPLTNIPLHSAAGWFNRLKSQAPYAGKALANLFSHGSFADN